MLEMHSSFVPPLIFQQVSANFPTEQPQHPSSASMSSLSRHQEVLLLFLGASVPASIDNLRLRGLRLFCLRLDVPNDLVTQNLQCPIHRREVPAQLVGVAEEQE